MSAKEKKMTIKEIASIAGVSKGTVSRVINDIEGVGPKTRARIKKLIKEYNYQPNAFARGLAEQKTRNIGIIIPHEPGYFLSNDYWPHLLSSISRYAVNSGYSILVSTTYAEGEIDSVYQSIFVGNKVDGLIIGTEIINEEQIKNLLKQDLPFIMIGKSPYFDNYYIDIDNYNATEKLTAHVIRQGYKKILFIAGPTIYPNVKERIDGFYHAINRTAGCTGKVFSTAYDKPDMEFIKSEITGGYKPDALILGAGDFALKVLMLLKILKIVIPEDIGLASFDTLDFYDVFTPGITSIRQPVDDMGKTASSMLFDRLLKIDLKPSYRILDCVLEIRESCNEPPAFP